MSLLSAKTRIKCVFKHRCTENFHKQVTCEVFLIYHYIVKCIFIILQSGESRIILTVKHLKYIFQYAFFSFYLKHVVVVVVSHDVLRLKQNIGVIMYRHAVVSTFIFAKAVAKN